MSPRLTRAQAYAQTRQQLLASAALVFARSGFEGATVDEIAEQADLSKGALYSHFVKKEDLFLALLDECLSREEQAFQSILEHHATFEARIHAISQWAPDLLGQPQDWLLLMTEFWLHTARHPELRTKLALRYQQQRLMGSRLLDQAYQEIGRTPPAPTDQLIDAVIALSHGLAMRSVTDPDALPKNFYTTALLLLLGGNMFLHEKGFDDATNRA